MTDIALEVNCATGVVTERPLTAQEIADLEAQAQAWATEKAALAAEAQAIANAKASATSKLAKLGLTTAEIQALLS